MADEDDAGSIDEPVKCPECAPGLPGWMATFSDMVTLLLTFFVLLLSFAKTESAKYEAALGSIRNAFGGNVLKQGEVIQKGKSPDDSPSMLESQEPIKPFPIDFLTMEGILDKHEINRESDEDLGEMKSSISEHNLSESVDIYEMPEGIKIRVKDKIYFEKNSPRPVKGGVVVAVYDKVTKLLTSKDYVVFVEGHASRGEERTDVLNGKKITRDAQYISSERAQEVTKDLVKRGVRPGKISTVSYGDTRPDKVKGNIRVSGEARNRRVEFLIRKRDLTAVGHKVESK